MTCIVGLRDGDRVWVGADSLASNGHIMWDMLDPKIFRNGDFLIGCSGSPRAAQLMQHAFSPPKKHADDDPKKYMATAFITELRDCFRSGGVCQKNNEVETVDVWTLVCFRSRIFHICSDFQIGERREGFDAIGSGEQFALGSLLSTVDKDPEHRVLLALQAAETYCTSVRGPFVIESS